MQKFLAKSEKPHKKLPKTAEPHTPDTPALYVHDYLVFLGLCLCDFEILCLAIFVSSWYIWDLLVLSRESPIQQFVGWGIQIYFLRTLLKPVVKRKIFFNRCVVKHSKNGKIKNPVLMQN